MNCSAFISLTFFEELHGVFWEMVREHDLAWGRFKVYCPPVVEDAADRLTASQNATSILQ